VQFSIVSGGGPFTLPPGDSRQITLRFSPSAIGRTSGRIAFDFDDIGSPAILHLFGHGIGGLVWIDDDSAFAGEHRDIPLRLRNLKSASIHTTAVDFRARIAYEPTILLPSSGDVA